MDSCNHTDRQIITWRFQALLVVLPHAVLTVEVEGVYSSRGAKQVVKLGLQSRLKV